jgi:predicted RND superfamily exporter protein
VSQINVDTNIFKYFRSDLKVTKDLVYFDDRYKGAANVEYLVTSKEQFSEEGLVKEPEFLQDVGDLEKFLEQKVDIGKGLTIPDFLKQIRQAFTGDDPKYYILPDSKEMTAQLLLLYENSGPDEDLSDLKDFDEKNLRMTFPITNMDASQFNVFVKNLNAEIADKFKSLSVMATGPMVMFQAQNEYTDKGITSSFTVSLVLISITFFILFRSVKFGAIAVIPSVIPILLAGGIATLMGKDLNLGSLIVGAMTMGIAVDDSIHMVSRYRLARLEGSNVHQAMQRAMNESGRAIITTSIILVIGFSVFLMASLVPTIDIGRFAAIIFLLALFGVLFFIPSLLYIIDGKDEKLGAKT